VLHTFPGLIILKLIENCRYSSQQLRSCPHFRELFCIYSSISLMSLLHEPSTTDPVASNEQPIEILDRYFSFREHQSKRRTFDERAFAVQIHFFLDNTMAGYLRLNPYNFYQNPEPVYPAKVHKAVAVCI
jgi:hypothetical protein